MAQQRRMGLMGVFIRSGRLLLTVPKTAEPQTPGQHLSGCPTATACVSWDAAGPLALCS